MYGVDRIKMKDDICKPSLSLPSGSEFVLVKCDKVYRVAEIAKTVPKHNIEQYMYRKLHLETQTVKIVSFA